MRNAALSRRDHLRQLSLLNCLTKAGWEYAARDYANGPSSDPHGPASGTGRTVRGGSWHVTSASWRSAFRKSHDAAYRGISIGIGFRL
jgi:formylglycine-generating enzyme required for sulfatase activity